LIFNQKHRNKLAFSHWLDELLTLYHIDLIELKYADIHLKMEIMRYGEKLVVVQTEVQECMLFCK
jgi:hypothetical protein